MNKFTTLYNKIIKEQQDSIDIKNMIFQNFLINPNIELQIDNNTYIYINEGTFNFIEKQPFFLHTYEWGKVCLLVNSFKLGNNCNIILNNKEYFIKFSTSLNFKILEYGDPSQGGVNGVFLLKSINCTFKPELNNPINDKKIKIYDAEHNREPAFQPRGSLINSHNYKFTSFSENEQIQIFQKIHDFLLSEKAIKLYIDIIKFYIELE